MIPNCGKPNLSIPEKRAAIRQSMIVGASWYAAQPTANIPLIVAGLNSNLIRQGFEPLSPSEMP